MNPRIAFIAAPLLTVAYGLIRIVDGLDGSRGPGLAWTVGHLAFLGALAMFVVTFWEMRRMAGKNTLSTVSAVAGITGVVALVAQFSIDIVVGFMSADRAGMGVLFDQIQGVPGVSLIVYDAGPALLFVGQLALVIQLVVMRRVPVWTPLLVLVNVVVPLVEKDLIPLGAVFLLIAFVPLARLASTPSSPEPAPVRA